jgi:predicted metal-dependent phosphoesterase TrpH
VPAEECESLLTEKRSIVSRLRQEIEALDEKFLKEVQEQHLKRQELIRRLAEHLEELSTASHDTIRHLQVAAAHLVYNH